MTDNKHAEAVEYLRGEVAADEHLDGVWLSHSNALLILAALNTRPDVEAIVGACAEHLRARAKGFRKSAFEQGKKAGPLAPGFEIAADEITQAIRSIPVPTSGEGGDHG